jgi:hypothetical protein
MAEFKINQFRYTWKGTWESNFFYKRDDVVEFAGSSWVCLRTHTSSQFNNDQIFLSNPSDTDPSPAWRKMTEGINFRNQWSQNTIYFPGDSVLYNGTVYICVLPHTSGSTFAENLSSWAIYSEGIEWKKDWEENTLYGINSVVKYGGIVYRCIEEHISSISANGLEQDLSKWQVYYENIEFVGEYQFFTKYRLNDLVLFNGSLLRCIDPYTSSDDFNDMKWQIEAQGFQDNQEWDPTTYYGIGSVVRSGGYLYYAIKASFNKLPINSIYQIEVEGPFWNILSKGINFRGIWNPSETYKTGDVVRRGGILYVAILDTVDDLSSLDYLDTSNWEIINVSQNFLGPWKASTTYSVGDLIVFQGNTYKANLEHVSSNENFPGDNGSGFFYWDLVLQAGSATGLNSPGDLLTFGLSRNIVGDQSTLGPTSVDIGSSGQLLTINDSDQIIYKDYSEINRVVYVSLDGVDDDFDEKRGISPFKPWRTVRYAAEKVNDNFEGTTTIRVGPGLFEEILPIIVPARTVVLGSELRTTTIKAAGAIKALENDASYTIAVLTRLSQIIPNVISGNQITKTPGNPLNQTVLLDEIPGDQPFDPPRFDENGEELFQPIFLVKPISNVAATQLLTNITAIQNYIRFFVLSTGSNPTMVGSNTAATDITILNIVTLLEANKNFLAEEAVAFVRQSFPNYNFDSELCKRDTRRYIESLSYDTIYSGNYRSILAARYYRNAVLGSQGEDMFYCRDSTGVRNCTLIGLEGQLNPPSVFDLYRVPTGGSYVSLDPGWGPNDQSTWIVNRSPYIQGVTTIGTGCVGQKIDGALHNGGNKSIVSNDFTQVLSDGVGAWVENGGRAELVSVFTYYCHVGYLAKNGGIIRATNGNNSYGRFGAVSDNVDISETPFSATVNNRNNQAIVESAFSGEFVDEIQLFEWANAGIGYTNATATIRGSGINASVVFEDFRDDAVYRSLLIDATPDSINQNIGGSGYSVQQNNAQPHTIPNGDLTSITIASNDPNSESDYLGKRIILTSGSGTGQYGYITAYDTVTKIVSVSRESDNQPGWDHVVPGTPLKIPLDTTTQYRIEPRITYSEPPFTVTSVNVLVSSDWSSSVYGETSGIYNGVQGGPGTGIVIEDDGLTPVTATFNVTKQGRNYTSVLLNNPGAGYQAGQVLTILGSDLGGVNPTNNLDITVTEVSNDSTNSIVSFIFSGTASSGRFVILTDGGQAGVYSSDGDIWETFNMPTSGDWSNLASGLNRFVAIRANSSIAALSLDGISWSTRVMPFTRNWSSVVFGKDKFVAIASNFNSGAYSLDGNTWVATTMPIFGDSTSNEWVDVTYGKNRFVAIANSQNIAAYSNDGITWTGTIMDVIADSSQKDWISIAYGNNRFVAISTTGDIAYSFDGENWLPASMPSQDGSTAHFWRKIKYGQGVFFAVGDTGSRNIGGDPTLGPSNFAATSPDGITWTTRTLSNSSNWRTIAFGNPYIEFSDSTVGRSTPMWIAAASLSSSINKIRTGARALGRVTVSAGVIGSVKIWNPGSGYIDPPSVDVIDPNRNAPVLVENLLGDGVLAEPSWLNRGLGYRSASTRVTIQGDGRADIIPVGKFVRIENMSKLPGPGALITFSGNPQIYTIVTITDTQLLNGEFNATIRVNPELKIRNRLEHLTEAEIREKYSQCRITGHDFLDIGTGNFEETNYPELYSTGLFVPAPENEVVEEEGGRVFYTSTDQSGNFRTGELFAVEQATGIVTISADFFDLSGLTELRLGGIRVGGTGAVIREFSTDPLFTEDSNNIVPTQRAIRAYLSNRLTVGGSEIATSSFIAGTVRVGPNLINSTISSKIVFPQRADFNSGSSGISGSWLAQTMFFSQFD